MSRLAELGAWGSQHALGRDSPRPFRAPDAGQARPRPGRVAARLPSSHLERSRRQDDYSERPPETPESRYRHGGYYDPTTGQFLSVDSLTLRSHVYAVGDPINDDDPSGLFPGRAVCRCLRAVDGSASPAGISSITGGGRPVECCGERARADRRSAQDRRSGVVERKSYALSRRWSRFLPLPVNRGRPIRAEKWR
jgi:hypothetical protein